MSCIIFNYLHITSTVPTYETFRRLPTKNETADFRADLKLLKYYDLMTRLRLALILVFYQFFMLFIKKVTKVARNSEYNETV